MTVYIHVHMYVMIEMMLGSTYTQQWVEQIGT